MARLKQEMISAGCRQAVNIAAISQDCLFSSTVGLVNGFGFSVVC